jgi:hypothetical protein
MEQYVGIDVSLELSSVCIVDASGKIVIETKVASEPEALVEFFKGPAPNLAELEVANRNQASEREPPCQTQSPLNNDITIDDERIKSHLDRVVRGTVEETLNALLDAEADWLCNAQPPVCYLDGIVLKRSWAGEVRNVSLLGCDRRERARLSGNSRHLQGGEGE